MVESEQVYKDCWAYLSEEMPSVDIRPFSQNAPPAFPSIMVNVKTETALQTINNEALAIVTIKCHVWANAFFTEGLVIGVLDTLDALNVLMASKGYRRTAETEPYLDNAGKWHGTSVFTKKTNTF